MTIGKTTPNIDVTAFLPEEERSKTVKRTIRSQTFRAVGRGVKHIAKAVDQVPEGLKKAKETIHTTVKKNAEWVAQSNLGQSFVKIFKSSKSALRSPVGVAAASAGAAAGVSLLINKNDKEKSNVTKGAEATVSAAGAVGMTAGAMALGASMMFTIGTAVASAMAVPFVVKMTSDAIFKPRIAEGADEQKTEEKPEAQPKPETTPS